MSTKILTKCVEELKKESPNIQYVLGMLETMIEIDKPLVTVPAAQWNPQYKHPVVLGQKPDVLSAADYVARQAEAGVAGMTGLIEKNLQTETNITLNTGK